jgi:hypothetical protein
LQKNTSEICQCRQRDFFKEYNTEPEAEVRWQAVIVFSKFLEDKFVGVVICGFLRNIHPATGSLFGLSKKKLQM